MLTGGQRGSAELADRREKRRQWRRNALVIHLKKRMEKKTYTCIYKIEQDDASWLGLASSPSVTLSRATLFRIFTEVSSVISSTSNGPSRQPFDRPTSTRCTLLLQALVIPVFWMVCPTTILLMFVMASTSASRSHWQFCA